MNSQSPAITAQSLAHEAGRKTKRVQDKLHDAESKLRLVNRELRRKSPGVRDAVEQNVKAEHEVHDAVEELEIVKTMLEHAVDSGDASPAPPAEPKAASHNGASGQGAKSLLPHLQRRR